MSMRISCRSLPLVLIPLLSLAATTRLPAQNRRADVRRLQWDPVVVHVAAEASLGVELYMSVTTSHWGLTWIRPDSLAAWLPEVRALMQRSSTVDSTPYLDGRGGSHFRIMKGVMQGRQLYALQLAAPPASQSLDAWLTAAYVTQLASSLEKSIAVARDLERAPAIANAFPVYEAWDVDSLPQGAAEEHFAASLPQYMARGSVVVGFVVDSAGHIVPSSVTVYDCDDPNLAKQWGREVVNWHFVGGMRDNRRVATRIRMAFDLDTGGSLQVNNQRIIPGRP